MRPAKGNTTEACGWELLHHSRLDEPYCVGLSEVLEPSTKKKTCLRHNLSQRVFSPWSLAFQNIEGQILSLDIWVHSHPWLGKQNYIWKRSLKISNQTILYVVKFPFIKKIHSYAKDGLFLPTIFPICSWTEQNKTDKSHTMLHKMHLRSIGWMFGGGLNRLLLVTPASRKSTSVRHVVTLPVSAYCLPGFNRTVVSKWLGEKTQDLYKIFTWKKFF